MRLYPFFLFASLALAQPNLSVNKEIFDATGVNKITTVNLSIPVRYKVEIKNAGDPSAAIQLHDLVPPEFQVASTTCHVVNGAVCPASVALPLITGLNISTGGTLEIWIDGYFFAPPGRANWATASPAPVNCPTTAQEKIPSCPNMSQITVSVPLEKLPVDLKVEKTVTPNTATLPATLNYEIKVTNPAGGADVYLGRIFSLTDQLRNYTDYSLSWSAASVTCNASASPAAICPELPAIAAGTLSRFSTQNLFTTRFEGGGPANDLGFLPAGGSFTLKFSLSFTTLSTCTKGPALNIENYASMNLSSPAGSVGDMNAFNNSVEAKATVQPPPAVGVCLDPTLTKELWNPVAMQWQSSPTWTPAFGQTLRYRISLKNPGTTTLTLPILDTVQKDAGTPHVTVDGISGPTCTLLCTLSGSAWSTPAAMPAENTSYNVWSANVTLPPGTSQIEYEVKYTTPCETDPAPDRITNVARLDVGGFVFAAVAANFKEERACEIEITKTGPGVILFEQPFQYQVTYKNKEAVPLTLNTVRDAMNIVSNRYGNLPIDYAVSCTAAPSGSITNVPAGSATNVLVKYEQRDWYGTTPIQAPMTFQPGALLACSITVTAHRPADTNPFCQGADDPLNTTDNAILRNSAYANMGGAFTASGLVPPPLIKFWPSTLPLCRKVIVRKGPKPGNPNPVKPGDTVGFIIEVQNLGDDPVSGLTVSDPVPAMFSNVTVGPCDPSGGCASGPAAAGNLVTATFAPIAPGQKVKFEITAQAPRYGGAFPNVVTGSFVAGGNWYFQGPADLLKDDEQIIVLSPTLQKVFGPPAVIAGIGGNTTLTFTIRNTGGVNPKWTGISFTDNLPAGLTYALTSNSCGGTATVSGNQFTLVGGTLIGANADGSGKPDCQIVLSVKAKGACGVFTNSRANLVESSLINIDVSGMNPTDLRVTECPPGLTIRKDVTGAPAGFVGKFDFLVECSTPTGPVSTVVSVTVPGSSSIVVPGIPVGSTCRVTESTALPPAPDGYTWSGTPVYSPAQVVVVGQPGVTLQVRNLMTPCRQTGEFKVTKKVEGVPVGFAGTFTGVVSCLMGSEVSKFPVSFTYPTNPTVSVAVPVGAACAFQENAPTAALPAGMVWDPPAYDPPFGNGKPQGECRSAVVVTNRAHFCCGTSTGGGENPAMAKRPASRK